MSTYHYSVAIIGRSGGKNATASAAYRAGEKIKDERTGLTFDYTRKSGVDYTEILAPSFAPEWASERSLLWNEVERVERRKDSQLAREINVALPVELDKEQNLQLVREFVQEQFVGLGMIADVAFHHLNSHNPHAHILLTMRDLTEEGFGKKNRSWNDRELLKIQREAWANHTNNALEKAGYQIRVDHRSLEAQGINRIPQIHLGPNVIAMEKKGIATAKMAEYREIEEINQNLASLEKSLAKTNQLIEELEETKETEETISKEEKINLKNPFKGINNLFQSAQSFIQETKEKRENEQQTQKMRINEVAETACKLVQYYVKVHPELGEFKYPGHGELDYQIEYDWVRKKISVISNKEQSLKVLAEYSEEKQKWLDASNFWQKTAQISEEEANLFQGYGKALDRQIALDQIKEKETEERIKAEEQRQKEWKEHLERERKQREIARQKYLKLQAEIEREKQQAEARKANVAIKAVAQLLNWLQKTEHSGEQYSADWQPELGKLTLIRNKSKETILRAEYDYENKRWETKENRITDADVERFKSLQSELAKIQEQQQKELERQRENQKERQRDNQLEL